MNMIALIASVLAGAALGAAIGYFSRCTTGACPLLSSWWRGGLYGAAIGGMFYVVAGRSGTSGSALNESTANVTRISEQQFDAEVLQAPMPVVVDVYATWCGPCKRLAPKLDEIAGGYTGRVKFVKVNVDQAQGLARRYEIMGVPTLLFFSGGRLVDRAVGVPADNALKNRLDELAGPGQSAEAGG
jgi:thioredoxin 1